MIDLLTRLRSIREGRPHAPLTTTVTLQAQTRGAQICQPLPATLLTLEARAEAKGLDVHEVVERAAIMEYDGGVPRHLAEQYALGEINDNQLAVMPTTT